MRLEVHLDRDRNQTASAASATDLPLPCPGQPQWKSITRSQPQSVTVCLHFLPTRAGPRRRRQWLRTAALKFFPFTQLAVSQIFQISSCFPFFIVSLMNTCCMTTLHSDFRWPECALNYKCSSPTFSICFYHNIINNDVPSSFLPA